MSNLKDPFTFAMKHSLPVRLDAHRHKLEVDEEIVRKKLNRHEEPPTNLVYTNSSPWTKKQHSLRIPHIAEKSAC